ncbi:MAG: hypothetical protein KDJ39_05870 [Gammaproteobacteria bacterium]|nr:hypothetical protein [Gammaproteobacteria bacterium]
MNEQLPQKVRGQRQKFKLPIDIVKGGDTVTAGTEVDLFPDQIERIKQAAEKAKAAAQKEG